VNRPGPNVTGPAGGRYEVMCTVSLPLSAVSIRHRSIRRASWSDELEHSRRRLVERCERERRPLLTSADGSLLPLYRLDAIAECSESSLVLATSATDYAEYMLTNLEHPEWRTERGAEVMSDPLGVSAVVRTADSVVLVGRRSGRPHDAPGALHVVPSGHPHPPQSVGAALETELRDELGLAMQEISDASITGVLRAQPSGKPEVTARFVATLDSDHVLERWEQAEERWEYEVIETVPWEPDVVADWLVQHIFTCVPPGHGAIALAGRVEFGPDWYESFLKSR
jgi:hypothetical protein